MAKRRRRRGKPGEEGENDEEEAEDWRSKSGKEELRRWSNNDGRGKALGLRRPKINFT